jgi:RNA polymerase sigma-70 factor (ECF subfamily)
MLSVVERSEAPKPANNQPSRRVGDPPSDPPSIATLVEAAQAGDRGAFAALYRRHARTVHAVLLARLPHAELRDAMQDTFTQALARISSLRDPAAFSPWLASIARNLARDWHKRGQPRRELAREPEQIDAERARPRDLDDALGLLAAMAQLPEGQRELLALRFVEGLSGPEIAAALGMTHGSVRVKLHHSVAALRVALGHQELDR